jgi:hypothetical protein
MNGIAPSLDFSRGARSAGECVVRTNLAERKEHSDVSGHTFPEMIPGKGEIVKEQSAAFGVAGADSTTQSGVDVSKQRGRGMGTGQRHPDLADTDAHHGSDLEQPQPDRLHFGLRHLRARQPDSP